MKVLEEEVPANLVPAAAVIRGGLALFFMTGRKEYEVVHLVEIKNPKFNFEKIFKTDVMESQRG